jgi:hypothetical protein
MNPVADILHLVKLLVIEGFTSLDQLALLLVIDVLAHLFLLFVNGCRGVFLLGEDGLHVTGGHVHAVAGSRLVHA